MSACSASLSRIFGALLAKAGQPAWRCALAGLCRHSEGRADGRENGVGRSALSFPRRGRDSPRTSDEVTRLILDSHDESAFAAISSLTVGQLREHLLCDETDGRIAAPGIGDPPEMAAAVSKLMRNQDLILVAAKCKVVTCFRNTLGLPGRLAVRLQPNHPTDDPRALPHPCSMA